MHWGGFRCQTELTIRTALATNPKAIVYGEDVAFGGVFVGLSMQQGEHRANISAMYHGSDGGVW